jgi:hypothetical protein
MQQICLISVGPDRSPYLDGQSRDPEDRQPEGWRHFILLVLPAFGSL